MITLLTYLSSTNPTWRDQVDSYHTHIVHVPEAVWMYLYVQCMYVLCVQYLVCGPFSVSDRHVALKSIVQLYGIGMLYSLDLRPTSPYGRGQEPENNVRRGSGMRLLIKLHLWQTCTGYNYVACMHTYSLTHAYIYKFHVGSALPGEMLEAHVSRGS